MGGGGGEALGFLEEISRAGRRIEMGGGGERKEKKKNETKQKAWWHRLRN